MRCGTSNIETKEKEQRVSDLCRAVCPRLASNGHRSLSGITLFVEVRLAWLTCHRTLRPQQLAIYTAAFTHAAPLERIVGDVVRLATFAIMLGSRATLT
jgi:hypothetical protein